MSQHRLAGIAILLVCLVEMLPFGTGDIVMHANLKIVPIRMMITKRLKSTRSWVLVAALRGGGGQEDGKQQSARLQEVKCAHSHTYWHAHNATHTHTPAHTCKNKAAVVCKCTVLMTYTQTHVCIHTLGLQLMLVVKNRQADEVRDLIPEVISIGGTLDLQDTVRARY